MKKARYPLPMRILHWLMALIILSLIAVGWFMTGIEKDSDLAESRGFIYGLHKSFGVLILFLVFLRIAVRLRSNIPELPKGIPTLEKRAAHAAHYILYALIVAVPVAGWAMSNYLGHPVYFFSLELPRIFPVDKEIGALAHDAHEYLAYTLLAVVALHFAGAMKHRFFDKKENDVLGRML